MVIIAVTMKLLFMERDGLVGTSIPRRCPGWLLFGKMGSGLCQSLRPVWDRSEDHHKRANPGWRKADGCSSCHTPGTVQV